MHDTKTLLVREIKCTLDASESEIFRAARKKLGKGLSDKDILGYGIYKKSIDARRRSDIRLVYTVSVNVRSKAAEKLRDDAAVTELKSGELSFDKGSEKLSSRPVIVGFGSAGMFAALILAEQGYRPIVIERGSDVPERVRKVDAFYKSGVLDTETNIQFGAGGAGTFSDGKLVTRINDKKCDYVLRRLRDLGAPDDILVRAKPHIGTDNLRLIVSNIKEKIIALGGEVRFDTRLEGIHSDSFGRVDYIITSNGDIPCGALILAIGHSARDTYGMLKKADFDIQPKPISVGVRIEHLQSDIDHAMYGDFAGHSALGHAEYALSKRVGERAVYTFCMCPGGEVVAAASEENRVVTNGMSRYARDGVNSNAALAVSVTPKDPMEFQRELESAAYQAGGGGYRAPVQTVGDFLEGRAKCEPSRIIPTYMNSNVCVADLNKYLSNDISEMLKIGLVDFNNKIKGFSVSDAVLTGFETRTSAPYRIYRGDDFIARGYNNIYPCGEGAGYAGGITSAAVDGINCALALISRFSNHGI